MEQCLDFDDGSVRDGSVGPALNGSHGCVHRCPVLKFDLPGFDPVEEVLVFNIGMECDARRSLR